MLDVRLFSLLEDPQTNCRRGFAVGQVSFLNFPPPVCYHTLVAVPLCTLRFAAAVVNCVAGSGLEIFGVVTTNHGLTWYFGEHFFSSGVEK